MLAILICGVVGHNMSVAYAAGAVILLKVLGLNQVIDVLGDKGITWGIILLTAAIFVPIATGKITWADILYCFQSPVGIVSLIVGAGVAIFGYLGVDYMKASPEVATALIIGTMIGVFFFRGIPVGPLIASGVVYVVMTIWQKLS
ncbi:MAG: DUF441 domain-containing protein [Veillonellaceae bacterium]|nr:DUF441 domain-containing protein [Veillonellaceae bacterium]